MKVKYLRIVINSKGQQIVVPKGQVRKFKELGYKVYKKMILLP